MGLNSRRLWHVLHGRIPILGAEETGRAASGTGDGAGDKARASDFESAVPDSKPNHVPETVHGRSGELTGQILDGRFEVGELLGKGGMSLVYRAWHTELGEQVAVKVLNPDHSISEQFRRLSREARLGSRLDHPNIVRVRAYGVYSVPGSGGDVNHAYMVMELNEGESLSKLVSKKGRIAPAEAIPLFLQIADGLAAAHAQGVIHRDLKPSNVLLVGQPPVAKLLDFGIARTIDGQHEQSLTATGCFVGTPDYVSPEHCLGQALDERSDIYSFGCLMFECLTGQPPFRSDSELMTLSRHVREPVRFAPPLDALPALARVVGRCLEKAPENRYAVVSELRRDLAELLETKGLLAIRTGFRETHSRAGAKVLVSCAIVLLCLVVVVGFLPVVPWLQRQNSASFTARSNMFVDSRGCVHIVKGKRFPAEFLHKTFGDRPRDYLGYAKTWIDHNPEPGTVYEILCAYHGCISFHNSWMRRLGDAAHNPEGKGLGSEVEGLNETMRGWALRANDFYDERVVPILGTIENRRQVHYMHGRILEVLGRDSEAEAEYVAALGAGDEQRRNPFSVIHAGRFLLKRGKLAEGCEAILTGVEGINTARECTWALNDIVHANLDTGAAGPRFFVQLSRCVQRMSGTANERCMLFAQLCKVAAQLGDLDGYRVAANRAIELAKESGDPELGKRLFQSSFYFLTDESRTDLAAQLLESAWEWQKMGILPLDDVIQAVRCLIGACDRKGLFRDSDTILAKLGPVRDAKANADLTLIRCTHLRVAGRNLAALGELRKCQAMLRKLRPADPVLDMRLHVEFLIVSKQMKEPDRAAAYLDEVTAMARAHPELSNLRFEGLRHVIDAYNTARRFNMVDKLVDAGVADLAGESPALRHRRELILYDQQANSLIHRRDVGRAFEVLERSIAAVRPDDDVVAADLFYSKGVADVFGERPGEVQKDFVEAVRRCRVKLDRDAMILRVVSFLRDAARKEDRQQFLKMMKREYGV